jgi:phage terminase large subunit-like protein
MNKIQITEELGRCIDTLDILDNVLIANKLRRIKESLIDEWELNEFYMELIKKELHYNENN